MSSHEFGEEEQSFEGYQEEPAFEAFMCPLTRQVMHDPVTIETGQTFDREAIQKWFRECRDSGRKPTCPLTQAVLRSTDTSPSVALRNVIEEWRTRNEEKELEKACNLLLQSQVSESSEDDALRALLCISQMCHRSNPKKDLVRRQGIIPTIAEMLKSSSSRRVRLKSLEVLRVVVEDKDNNKEELGKGDTIRTIIKFLSNEHLQERELAVSLLYELSTCESTCHRIGAVYGAILLLVGMGSSKSENNAAAVEKAEKTLRNLEKYETNVKQMAENGRLQPLLTQLVHGTPEVQLAMAEYLGDLALASDVKVVVAEQVGELLVATLKETGGSLPAREATLKALREISSNDSSGKLLLQAGILPPLVKGLLSVGAGHLPMRLKEVSAAILANLVASGAGTFPLDDGQTTLVSEEVVHSLLHLISNTGPAIECKLLSVLVGLTASPATVGDVVSGIRSSGAAISLLQLVEAAHREIRVEALKLLRNVSPYMGAELADALGVGGHLSSLLRWVAVDDNVTTEEHAAALGLLGDLPERDWNLTRQLLDLGAFRALAAKLRRGAVRDNRHVAAFTEGAVKVLYRVTCALSQEEAEYVELAREAGLAPLFVDLLQQMSSGLDAVQLYSAMALENLSLQSRSLTVSPPAPLPSGVMCACFLIGTPKKPAAAAAADVCRVHGGVCSLRGTFCLAEPGCKAVERLVACLEHADARVVEAALAALSTLVGDGVENATEGVLVLGEAEGLRPVVEVLVNNRTEALRRRAVWAVERILRVEDIAQEVAADQTVASALVEAYRNGDAHTRRTAERALRHLDRIPNFSTVFHRNESKKPV